jgi:hypothetical protein
MNKMIGISMMITGLILLVTGYLTYNTHQKKELQAKTTSQVSTESMAGIIQAVTADGVLSNKERAMVEKNAAKYNLDAKEAFDRIDEILSSEDNEAETEIINQNKKKGDDFEKFIIKKFNKQYFTIKQWAGDKFIDGTYSEKTQQPDIIVEFNLRDYSKKVAIECKWRSSTFKGGVQVSYADQLKRYKEFEQQEKTDVYIALGIGGRASMPDSLYLIPLKSISNPFISENDLSSFKMKIDNSFFLNAKNGVLNM